MKKKTPKLTDEEKARFGPMLQQTWESIASDAIESAGRNLPVCEIIEITCDANRPMEYGGMSREEWNHLCECYHHSDTRRWLRQILNY